MIPILPLLRSRLAGYVVGAILAAALTGAMAIKVSRLESQLAQSKAEYAQLVAGYAEASRLRQEHALRLVQAARAEEIAAGGARVQAEREAAERLREAAREATRQAGEWRARLREAQAQDASCAAWYEQRISCPVD
jgi:hypothetical protein